MENSKNENLEALLIPLRKKIEKHHIKFCSFADPHFSTVIVGEQFDYDIAKGKAESSQGFKSLLQICIQNKILCRIVPISKSPLYLIWANIMNRKLKKAKRSVDKEIVTFLLIAQAPEVFFKPDETPEQIAPIIDTCIEMYDDIEKQLRSIHQS